jgi:2-methylcitrate dehydratase PrpD
VHQSKFSMGTVLAMVALHGRAGLAEFDAHYRDAAVVDFRNRVHMALDAEVDAAYPARWIGKVEVTTRDGRRLAARVDEPKGDPGNTLSRADLEDKAIRLAGYGGGASEAEMRGIAAQVWTIAQSPVVGRLLR